jgi:hypothetical protein
MPPLVAYRRISTRAGDNRTLTATQDGWGRHLPCVLGIRPRWERALLTVPGPPDSVTLGRPTWGDRPWDCTAADGRRLRIIIPVGPRSRLAEGAWSADPVFVWVLRWGVPRAPELALFGGFATRGISGMYGRTVADDTWLTEEPADEAAALDLPDDPLCGTLSLDESEA